MDYALYMQYIMLYEYGCVRMDKLRVVGLILTHYL